jgi:YNFM family putative membrane transporter
MTLEDETMTEAYQQGIAFGSREYVRISWALFLAGFATFASIYCVQPLLPVFAHEFGVTPASSSLALSLTTGLLALAIAGSVGLSHAFDRRALMFGSMVGAAGLNLAVGLVPGWSGLLVLRALAGLVLGGVPAVAMAHLADEIRPSHLGRSMGLYVAGTAFGGMSGRVGMGLAVDWVGWRTSMVLFGLACAASALGFVVLLPRPRRVAEATGFRLARELHTFAALLRHGGLLRLVFVGCVLNSAFVTLFNNTTFRLTGAPYGLSQTATSLLFLTYALGMFASSWSGILADRMGSSTLLRGSLLVMLAGVVCTLASPLAAITLGVALATIGFFAGHAVASGAVGRLAGSARGHASALYLLTYYLGSSLLSVLGAWVWQHGGWVAVAAYVGTLIAAGLTLAAETAESPEEAIRPPQLTNVSSAGDDPASILARPLAARCSSTR